MPKFKFVCNKCGEKIMKMTPASWVSIPCKCGGVYIKQIPNIKGTVVKEVVDKERKVEWVDDQEKKIKDRSKEHFWKVEVPEMVRSGVYSIKTMIENGWVYYDDKQILQIRTSPPEKDEDIKK